MHSFGVWPSGLAVALHSWPSGAEGAGEEEPALVI